MKKLFVFLFSLILSVVFSTSASAYDVKIDGLYYNLNSEGKTAEVTVNWNDRYSGEVVIPSSITVEGKEYTVKSIGNEAFYKCSGLTSVDIPNSVTSIGDYAFGGYTGLTSINIPNSVTSIGDCALFGCSGLKDVIIVNNMFVHLPETYSGHYSIPENISQIIGGAFYNCKGLTSVTIPNSVTSIGDYTFYNCSGLTSVTIPNSVTSIGDYTFYNCSGLTSVTIPNSVKSIEYGAFKSCSNLENVYCYAEKFSSIGGDIFKDSYIEYATLHVPSSAISYYQTTEPWSGFGTIKTLEGTDVGTKKCETPTISFADGKLTFSCATEGVEYESEVTCSDVNKYYSNEINLAACYYITVTAMKSGFSNSDIATAKLYWLTTSGTLDTNINTTKTRGIVIQSAGGFITLSGLDTNERVDFFTVDGVALGSATATNGTATFSATNGTIVIAKIGKESVKIAVE